MDTYDTFERLLAYCNAAGQDALNQLSLKEMGINSDDIEKIKKDMLGTKYFDDLQKALNESNTQQIPELINMIDDIRSFQEKLSTLYSTDYINTDYTNVVPQIRSYCTELQTKLKHNVAELQGSQGISDEMKTTLKAILPAVDSILGNLEIHVGYLEQSKQLNKDSLRKVCVGTGALLLGVVLIVGGVLSLPFSGPIGAGIMSAGIAAAVYGMYNLAEARDKHQEANFMLKKAHGKEDGEYSSGWITLKQNCAQVLATCDNSIKAANTLAKISSGGHAAVTYARDLVSEGARSLFVKSTDAAGKTVATKNVKDAKIKELKTKRPSSDI